MAEYRLICMRFHICETIPHHGIENHEMQCGIETIQRIDKSATAIAGSLLIVSRVTSVSEQHDICKCIALGFAESEEERKEEMREKQMQTIFVPEISFLSFIAESQSLANRYCKYRGSIVRKYS